MLELTTMKQKKEKESLAVGGQAVMEGVMMRDGDRIAIAVRKPNGKIGIKKDKYNAWSNRIKFFKWPFIRGMVSLLEIMIIGMKAMIWSSNQATGEEEENFSFWEIFLSIIFAVVFGIAIFKLLPLFLATTFENKAQTESNILFNLIDGGIKLGLFIGYIWLISLMKDVKRLFQYHGSEHKSINCFEQGKKLTVKNVLGCSRFHPRCGTTFVLFVFFISILVYLFIPLETAFWTKLAIRIVLLPVISGISYELIKLGGKHYDKLLMKILLSPGMFFQRLTTKEPDATQVEVAIASLNAAITPFVASAQTQRGQ